MAAKCAAGPGGGPTVEEHRTWAQLGLSPAVGRLAEGRTVLFAATGDQPFVEAGALPDGIDSLELFGSDAGFWAVYEDWTGSSSTTHASSSTDGRTWTASPAALEGAPVAVGELAGRPTVALRTEGSAGTSLSLHGLSVDGTGRAVDVSASLGDARAESYVVDADFGPMGFAATIAHSPAVPGAVPGPLRRRGGVLGGGHPGGRRRPRPLRLGRGPVSADAITVRLFDHDVEPRPVGRRGEAAHGPALRRHAGLTPAWGWSVGDGLGSSAL